MREVVTSIGSRAAVQPQKSSVGLQAYASPVDTYIAPAKNQTLLQLTNGLSKLVPELNQAADTLIAKQIKQDQIDGKNAQILGEAPPSEDNAWKLHGYQQASAVARSIEFSRELESEAATKFNPQDPHVWDEHGDPLKAVDSFVKSKSQAAIAGMRPEYAALFLQNVEKTRVQLMNQKQQEVQKYHYENKLNNLGVISEAAIKENIANNKLSPEDSRGLFSFLRDKAVHELGIDREDASNRLANTFMTLANDEKNPNPDLLNFLDVPDKDGIKLSMTKAGVNMQQAREAAQRAKTQQVNWEHVAAWGEIEAAMNKGEDIVPKLMSYAEKYPEHARGKDTQFSEMIVRSGEIRERLEQQKLTEEMMSPDYYANLNLDLSDLKKLQDSNDLEGADRKATEMHAKYGKDFDNKELGKAKAEIIKRAEAMKNYTALSLVDLPDGTEKDEAATMHLQGMEKEGKRRGLDDAQITNQKLAWLSTQGYVDKGTKAKLNNGFVVTNLDPNAPPPPEFMTSVKMAQDLYRMNPELYHKTVTDDTRKIMQMYSSALDEGGMSPEMAYAKVVSRLQVPLHQQPLPAIKIAPDDVEKLITSGGMFSKGTVPGYDDMQNKGQVLQKIIAYANENYEFTGNKDKAIQDAFERFNSQTVKIKGNAVWVGDVTKYPDMEDVIDYRIKSTLGYDKDSEDAKSVTVVPTGVAGMFGLMVNGKVLGGSNFMLDDVRKEYHKSLDITSDTAASMWTKAVELRKSRNPSGKTMQNWFKGKPQ